MLDAWRYGKQTFLDQLIGSIKVTSNDELLREYRLAYDQIGVGNYSRISDVQMCDINGACTPKTVFAWEELRKQGNGHVNTLNGNTKFNAYRFVDLNQDGFKDACYVNNYKLHCSLYDAETGKMSAETVWSTDQQTASGKGKVWLDQKPPRFLDLNNDGYSDYCIEGRDGVFCGINDKNNRFISEKYWTTVTFYEEGCEYENCVWVRERPGFNKSDIVKYVDINNDNYSDICSLNAKLPRVSIEYEGNFGGWKDGGEYIKCAINNKEDGFKDEFSLSAFSFLNSSESGNSTAGFIDINGDGLTDLCGLGLRAFQGAGSWWSPPRPYEFACLINKRSLNGAIPEFSEPVELAKIGGYSGSIFAGVGDGSDNGNIVEFAFGNRKLPSSFQYVDLNADNLLDICHGGYKEGHGVYCAINKGGNFSSFRQWSGVKAEWGVNFEDINNDGRADLCYASTTSYQCALNGGTGFLASEKYTSLAFRTDVYKVQGRDSKPGPTPLSFHEINGDGGLDVCYRSYAGLDCQFGSVYENSLLTGITTGYGNETTIKYGQISNFDLYEKATSEPTNPLLRNVNGFRRVVESVSTSNGIGGKNSLKYKYADLKFHIERGLRSFRKITETNVAANKVTKTWYHQGDNTEDINNNGLLEKTVVSVDGVTVNEASITYDISQHPDYPAITIRRQDTQANTRYELDGKEISTTQTSYEDYDKYGTAKKVIIENKGGGASTSKTTTSSYKPFLEEQWLVAKPENITVKHESSDGATVTRKTSFTYNDDGSLKSETLEPGSPKSLTTTFEYDSFGNKTKTTTKVQTPQSKQHASFGEGSEYASPLERSASIVFDTTYGLHIESRTNAKNHTEFLEEYDERCSSPSKLIGVNKLATRVAYDSLCRKSEEWTLDGTANSIHTQWRHEKSGGLQSGDGITLHAAYKIIEQTDGLPPAISHYDSLGREVRKESIAFNGKRTFEDKVYNAKGEVVQASLPYYEGTPSVVWVKSTYDSLGRTSVQIHPNGTSSKFVYEGLKTTITDPRGNSKTTIKNLHDKPAKVIQAVSSSSSSILTFKYNAIGDLVTTDSNGSITQIDYDQLGHKVGMQDPVMGDWEYGYNGYGELIWQQDAKKQITILRYDELSRKTTQTHKDNNGRILESNNWVYDKGNKGIGKLAESRNPQARKVLTYDDYGRPKATRTEADYSHSTPTVFETSLEYDQLSRPIKEVYPGGIEVNRDYTKDGFLKSVYMPANQVRGYDWEALDKEFEILEQHIGNISAEVASLRKTQKDLLSKANSYKIQAEVAIQAAQPSLDKVKELKRIASVLRANAEKYQLRADYFQEKGESYKQKYGDLVFTYISSTEKNGGSGRYQAAQCSWNWKGMCLRNTTHAVDVNQSDLSGRCLDHWTKEFCAVSYPAKLDLAEFYLERANEAMLASEESIGYAVENEQESHRLETSVSALQSDAIRFKKEAEMILRDVQDEFALLQSYEQQIIHLQERQDEIERIRDEQGAEDRVVLWQAIARDEGGRLQTALLGNSIRAHRFYDPRTGQLRHIKTDYGNEVIRDIHYTYDEVNNVESREDRIQDIRDDYDYDGLDRLDYVARSNLDADKQQGAYTHDFNYDLHGNLKTNLGLTSMVYTGNQLDRIERKNSSYADYAYDANGNMEQVSNSDGSKRDMRWTSFDKIEQIKEGNNSTRFEYDADHNRVKQMLGANGRNETIYYHGKSYEYIIRNEGASQTTRQHKYYIYAEGQVIAIQQRTENHTAQDGIRALPDETRYLHKDALGSVDTITDANGFIIQRANFDPFGKRHIVEDHDPYTTRGYTGHEHLTDFNLIHMNARLYDPEIARFTSADTVIPDAGNSQAYNRYVYVYNNPLKYTDPSGHDPFLIAMALTALSMITDSPIIDQLAVVAWEVAIPGSSFVRASSAEFIVSLANGADLEDAAEGAVIAGVGAAGTTEIGHGDGGKPIFKSKWGKRLAHGVWRGAISEMRGGDFKSGFVSAVVASTAGDFAGAMGLSEVPTVFIAGGLAAEATGGDFAEGAASAVAVHLYNDTWSISLSGNAGSGPGATGGMQLSFDDEWNISYQTVKGVGLDVPSISMVLNVTHTDADTVDVLKGKGADVTLEVGEIILFETGSVSGAYGTDKFYTGKTFGLGLGGGASVTTISAYSTDTTEHVKFNPKNFGKAVYGKVKFWD